jgi:acyl carrier protein
MNVKQVIIAQITRVAQEQKHALARLTDDLALLESGLDSLGFATLVARLEDELGVDPFSADEDVDLPITLGDFVQVYENARK